MQQCTHKRGDSFIAKGEYRDEAGNTVDLATAGVVVTSSVRWRDRTYPLDVTVQDYRFTISADTENWPLGRLIWDVQFVQDGVVTSTDSVIVDVLEDATP